MEALVPLGILGVTLALLSLGRLPGLGARRHRHWVALGGGLAMIVAGALSLPQAWDALNLPILGLLFGMLALAASLEVCGFFDWLAWHVVERARNQRSLLAWTMIASAALSALFLNDAVVLLFTPVLVKACRQLRVDAMPYLAGEAIAANIGSVATPVGNPQNAYIAIASGIPFSTFALALLPLAAASLLVAIAILTIAFRRSLALPLEPSPSDLGPRALEEPRLFRGALAILFAVFAGFIAAQPLGLSLAWVAFGGGMAVLIAATLLAPAKLRRLARGIDLTILVFFVGLFWLVAGFRASGFGDDLERLFLGGQGLSALGLTGWAAALSNLVSNVPAVLLIAPVVQAAGSTSLWLVLAGASTLAGNATLVGAAANVIVAETARSHGAEFSVKRFMLVGLPVTLATLAILLVLFRG